MSVACFVSRCLASSGPFSCSSRSQADKLQRRREQVRLAQRAYRSRKEGTLIALEQRTKNLKTLVRRMDREFRNLCESMGMDWKHEEIEEEGSEDEGEDDESMRLRKRAIASAKRFSDLVRLAGIERSETDENGEHDDRRSDEKVD